MLAGPTASLVRENRWVMTVPVYHILFVGLQVYHEFTSAAGCTMLVTSAHAAILSLLLAHRQQWLIRAADRPRA